MESGACLPDFCKEEGAKPSYDVHNPACCNPVVASWTAERTDAKRDESHDEKYGQVVDGVDKGLSTVKFRRNEGKRSHCVSEDRTGHRDNEPERRSRRAFCVALHRDSNCKTLGWRSKGKPSGRYSADYSNDGRHPLIAQKLNWSGDIVSPHRYVISEPVFFHELSLIYGKEGLDTSLMWDAPVFVPCRYSVVIVGTVLNGRETFEQQEFRLPFAVYLVAFGICYVLIRCLQDWIFTRRHAKPS